MPTIVDIDDDDVSNRKARRRGEFQYDESGNVTAARVPMMLRDSDADRREVQRQIKADAARREVQHQIADRERVVDGAGDAGLALNRPGSRMLADRSAYDAVADAYDEMCRASSDAWKRGPGGHQDALAHGTEYAEGREGDPCTVCAGAAEGYLEGSPGHLARVDGKLVCVPDKRRSDCMSPADAERIKKATYDEMCRAGEQAWKNLGQH